MSSILGTHELVVDVRLELDRFDLAVAFETTHRVTGIFGVSGSGKTSLLETVAGLRRPKRGHVALGGRVWLDTDASRFVRPELRDIGYVPQDGLLFPNRTVRGNLLAGRKRAVLRGTALDEVFETVVELLELRPLLDRPAPTLSGGERQRVALGRAICSGPSLLLLDEPLASLDLGLRRRLLPFLGRLNEEFRIPSLFVSHDPVEVQALCDDLVVLHEGRVVAHGRPSEVLTDAAVYSRSEQQGFENVLPCELVESSGGTSRVRPDGAPEGIELVTVAASGVPGDRVLVGLPANEIILAMEEPRGLSARNALPATVTRIRTVGALGLVTVELAGDVAPLTIEITDTTAEALGLVVGARVHLVFKATSCRVYGD